MENEIKLILLAVLRKRTAIEDKIIDDLLYESLDWNFIIGNLVHHRLCGYFYFGLGDARLKKVNNEVRKMMKLIVDAQKLKEIETNNELEQIIKSFETNHVDYAMLKGVSYSTDLYHQGIRRSNDIDILMMENQLDVVDKILKSGGYIQTYSNDDRLVPASRKEILIQRMNYHDIVPYVRNLDENAIQKRMEIDINIHFDSKENDITKKVFDYGTVYKKLDKFDLKCLPWETNLAHLCVHFHREATNTLWTEKNRDMVLYKLVDIMNFINHFATEENKSNWTDVITDLNLSKQAYFTLYVLNELYESDVIKYWMNEINLDSLDFINEIQVEGKDMKITRKMSFKEQIFHV
jgi:hypothetical protein